ncbi:MAG: endo alpha-1,4 polygalactosaminidase [Kiritimatiellae bacterium]|nr:endo alpha-1,4 polygalactosaminidase [Kiritimatiellia bacterium]
MNRKSVRRLCLVPLCCFISLGCTVLRGGDPDAGPRRQARAAKAWLCYYGNDRDVLTANPLIELLVLDADELGPLTKEEKNKRLCLAYLSVGEAEDFRMYWQGIRNKSWVLGSNPDWAGDHLVDVRSKEWRRLVTDEVAPRLMAAGYDGFMLDTLDTAETLLQSDPVSFAGVKEAMAELVLTLRNRWPDAVILVNRGFDILPLITPQIDGVLVEGVRSTMDFKHGQSRMLTTDECIWIEKKLEAVQHAGLPVFALDYVVPPDPEQATAVYHRLQRLGYRPLISTPDLAHYDFPYVHTGP